MTTIAYRDGVLAADSLAYFDRGSPSPGFKMKVWRLPNGDRLGVSSCMVGAGEKIHAWFATGEKGDRSELPTDYALILVKGRDQLYVGNNSVNLSGPIASVFFAIGTGDAFAMGAMQMGASAPEAVKAAIALDRLSGGPIHVLGPTA